MNMSTPPEASTDLAVRVIQLGSTEEDLVRPAEQSASTDEITASMSSCVVHLCGCK